MFGPGFYRLDFPSDISLGVFRLARLASSEDNTIRMFGLTDSHISQQSQLRLVRTAGALELDNANCVDLARRLT